MTGNSTGGKREQIAECWAGTLPLSYSWSTAAKAAKPPLASSLQLLFPINYALYTPKTFPHFPFPLQCQKMGKSEKSFFKGTQKLSEWSFRGNNRRGGLRRQQEGGELKGTNWESLPGQLHTAQQQGQESPSGHCWLSPLQSHTHRHTHPHIVWPMKGCTGVLGMSSVTQYV